MRPLKTADHLNLFGSMLNCPPYLVMKNASLNLG